MSADTLVLIMVGLVCFQAILVVLLFFAWRHAHFYRRQAEMMAELAEMSSELAGGLAQELGETSEASRERMHWNFPKAPEISDPKYDPAAARAFDSRLVEIDG